MLEQCSATKANESYNYAELYQQTRLNVDEIEEDGELFLKDDGLLIASSSLNPDPQAEKDSSWRLWSHARQLANTATEKAKESGSTNKGSKSVGIDTKTKLVIIICCLVGAIIIGAMIYGCIVYYQR